MPSFTPWILSRIDRYIGKKVDQEFRKKVARRDNLMISQEITASHELAHYDSDTGKVTLATGEVKTAIVAGDPAAADTAILYPNSANALIVHHTIRQDLYSDAGRFLLIEKSKTPDDDGIFSYQIKDLEDDNHVWQIDTYAISGAVALQSGTDIINAVVFSPNGKHLFVGAAQGDPDPKIHDHYTNWGYILDFQLKIDGVNTSIEGDVSQGSKTFHIEDFERTDLPPVPPTITSLTTTVVSGGDSTTYVSNWTSISNTDVVQAVLDDQQSGSIASKWSISDNPLGGLRIDLVGNYQEKRANIQIFTRDSWEETVHTESPEIFTESGVCPNPGTQHPFTIMNDSFNTADYARIVGTINTTVNALCEFSSATSGCLTADQFGPGCPTGDSSGFYPADTCGSGSSSFFNSFSMLSFPFNVPIGTPLFAESTCLALDQFALRHMYSKNINIGDGIFSVEGLEGTPTIDSMLLGTLEYRQTLQIQVVGSSGLSEEQATFSESSTNDGHNVFKARSGYKSVNGVSAAVFLDQSSGNYHYFQPYLSEQSDVGNVEPKAYNEVNEVWIGNSFPGDTEASQIKTRDTTLYETFKTISGESVRVRRVSKGGSGTYSTEEEGIGNQSDSNVWDVIDFTTRNED